VTPKPIQPLKPSIIHNVDISSGSVEDYYTMGCVLGKGGFGVVREACRIDMPEEVKFAIKSIKKFSTSGKVETSCLTEIDMMGSLDHPNIIRLHEVFEDSENYHIVMDRCSTTNLYDAI
jgi:serine/threonine protein kinase